MKKMIVLLLGVFSLFENPLKAQENSTDSIQRVTMKDSLNISDAVVTQIFSIRDNFLNQSSAIIADTLLTQQQKTVSLQDLRIQTNDGIKTLLGETKYDQYVQMIRRRMANRPRANFAGPLASGADN